MMAVDTDVLAIYYIFRWDNRLPLAEKIIDSRQTKILTIINALELAGLMAIAQDGLKANKLFISLHRRKDFKILYWEKMANTALIHSKNNEIYLKKNLFQ